MQSARVVVFKPRPGYCSSDTLTKGITMAKKQNTNYSQPPCMPQRRGFVAAATTLLVFPVIPRLAHASQVVAVRTWPADEYTRVTLELGSELKTEHFTLDNPDRLVVDLHGVKLNDTLKQLNGMVQANDPYIKEVRVGQNTRSEEHTSELQSRGHLVCRLLLEKKKEKRYYMSYKISQYE